MNHEVLAIDSYHFAPGDMLLLDTNIWLFLFGPQLPREPRVEIYSKAFEAILDAKCRIFIDVLIVSEFINAYSRMKWNIMDKPCKNFKRFRKTRAFKPIAKDIAADIRRVLKHCERIESGFDKLAINDLIAEYELADSDFNDQVIADLCQTRGLKLVTHDSDFRSQDITIVTANQKLLG